MEPEANNVNETDAQASSRDGSQDLFTSQSPQGCLINEQIDITLQLTESVWVQCDNPDCQKWRRVPAADAENLGDDPWFCHMTSDLGRNTCEASEEDHSMYDRMAKKAGIKFVMSMLDVGSLVWAKMAGYCRWPALITQDPDAGAHVLIDIDGDPHSYHVEFLGTPHSHSWVAAKFVDVYGHKTLPALEAVVDRGLKKQRSRGRARTRIMRVSDQFPGKIRKSYRRMHIATVVGEADHLLNLSSEDRMKYSTIKFDPDQIKIKKTRIGKKDSKSSCEKCSQCNKTEKEKKYTEGRVQPSIGAVKHVKRKSNYIHTKREKIHVHGRSCARSQSEASLISSKNEASHVHSKSKASRIRSKSEVDRVHTRSDVDRIHTLSRNSEVNRISSNSEVNLVRTKRCEMQAASHRIKGKENLAMSDYASDRSCPSLYEVSMDEGISVKTINTDTSGFDSPDQFSQSRLKFTNSMVDKTKEEKFSIDIDMYRKNEAAFEHDVRRFMSRNGHTIRNTPVWHTVPVRLFQLYLAVHERGGFQRVTKRKLWSAIYKELTEQQHVSGGAIYKKYYYNNLYPYELYITCKDYEDVLNARKKQSKKRTGPTVIAKGIQKKAECLNDDGASLSQDIEAILGQLDDDYCPEPPHKVKPYSQPGIRFHEDNTDSQSNTAHTVSSEFHSSTTPEDNVQAVPGDNFTSELSDIEENILHEMKALEDEMKEIYDLDYIP